MSPSNLSQRTASATPPSSDASSLRPSAKPLAKHSPPPPIPIPHLLLDRSRLKPVPKTQPAPLQPPPAFHHLMPLRSKLRSTTAPVVPTTSSLQAKNVSPDASLPSRSVSGSMIPTSTDLSPDHSNATDPLPQPPDQSSDTNSTASDTPTTVTPVPFDQPHQPTDQDHCHTPTNTEPTTPCNQITPETPNPPHLSPTMAETLDHSTPSLSPQQDFPDQSPPASPSSPQMQDSSELKVQDSSEPQVQDSSEPQVQDSSEPQVQYPLTSPPQDALPSQTDHNPDEIQPWQNQFNLALSSVDHSSLERANSAAARLDSLARLNGVRIPDSSARVHTLDVLPPFLMAKHIEETKKRVELGQIVMDTTLLPLSMPSNTNYPLPLPASLGFSVGPNGRGVPRLSALQRKALEKIANQQGSPDLSTATTSLTRSHTTTGTESPKHHTNRIQQSTTDESHERQQARSNLIRKLSSRGAHSRPRLQLQSPPPTQLLGGPQESLNIPPLRCTPEFIPSSEQPHLKTFAKQEAPGSAEPFSIPQPSTPSTSATHSFDLNQVEISQLGSVTTFSMDSNFKTEGEPVIQSKQLYVSDESIDGQFDMTSHIPDQCVSTPQQSSLNRVRPDPSMHAAPENVSIGASGTSLLPSSCPSSSVPRPQSQHNLNQSHENTINTKSSHSSNQSLPPSERCAEVAQLQSRLSLSDSHSVLTSSLTADADVNARFSRSHKPNHSTDSSAASAIATQALNPPSSSSVRSSIVSRLKARASLSSRIDRSLASGRPTSPIQKNNPQSSVSHNSDNQADRRRSANQGNLRISRPSHSSSLQRLVNATQETSEDNDSKPHNGNNRGGATSPSKPFYHGERSLRPIRAPPIAEAHNVVGRGPVQPRTGSDLGPSQFPPTPHLVQTHMPVASAVDLARYNDQKLAPFPGLLNMTPPSSPERSRSPRSSSKTPKSANHGILSSATNFFRSPRSREESLSSERSVAPLGMAKDVEPLLPSKYSMHMNYSNNEEEEVVDSSRWQSIGDVAEKMSSPIPMSRSSTVDSHQSSTMSMISNQRREQILARLSPFLKPPSHFTPQNLRLHDPPRKLLWHQPVLQVANSASFKDRYLFLFSDILVITKPLLEFEDCDGERVPKLPITLEQTFLTKSVVELKDLRFMSTGPHEPVSSYEADLEFKEAFQRDPSQAVQMYLDRTNVQNRDHDIAKLLLSTCDLDKRQLGQYLTGPEHTNILKNYLEQLNFTFMRLEDALRAVLLSLRLPADPDAINRFLEQFGTCWTACNPKVDISAALATRWATAMVVLSEYLHDGLTDSMRYVAGLIALPNKLKTEAQFVDMVKGDFDSMERKISTSLPADKFDAMLKKAYQSIRRDRLVQARANPEDTEKVQLITEEGNSEGLSLPNHLTYQVPSELITVSIPKPDPQFGIKLFGPGLSFEPPFLSFSHAPTASFRIKGKAIGMRQISFIKIGRRAAAYEGLPLNMSVSVERAFMQHTVQVGFYNHLSVKRKYLLSFHGSEPKAKFTELIASAQKEASIKSSQIDSPSAPQAMGKMVALQVLRDTLILNEDLVPMNVNPYASTTVVLTAGSKKSKTAKAQDDNLDTRKTTKIRSNSLSETYIHTMGKNEKDLHQAIIDRRNQAQESHIRNKQKKLLKEQLKGNLEGGKMGLNPYSCSNKENPVGVADENQNQFLISKFAKSGLNLIQHCEQNSLIPLVLGFLSMGAVEKVGTNNSHSSLSNYSSQTNLRGSLNQEDVNRNMKKQTSHVDNRKFYQSQQSQNPSSASTSSLFNLARFTAK